MRVAVADGDGIGPEVMKAALQVLTASGAPIDFIPVNIGESHRENGTSTCISAEARHIVESCRTLFTGPMGDPTGRGVSSVNATARKMWNAYASKRIFRTLPGVPVRKGSPAVDITIVRENIEDGHGSIEHMQTHDVAQSRRLVTRPGSEQVVRYAFEVARRKGARRITCGHKANVMKLTDGMFLDVFNTVAQEYPDLQADDRIVDTLAMELVMDPEQFEVIVLPSLQADILSDLCAGLVGGRAYAPSASIGEHVSIFEAVQSAAPEAAGQDSANPTAMILAGCIMLRHLGLREWADRIESALHKALRVAFRPPDLCAPLPAIRTSAFAKHVVDILDAMPAMPPVPVQSPIDTARPATLNMMVSPRADAETTKGVDLFIDSDRTPAEVAQIVNSACKGSLSVTSISNRGTQVWPSSTAFADCVNHHRVRVEATEAIAPAEIFALAGRVSDQLRVCSLEALLQIGSEAAYSIAQGQ